MTDRKLTASETAPAGSVLQLILGTAKLSQLARVSRATRSRELVAQLGDLVHSMDEGQRAAFGELCALVREENTDALDSQMRDIEEESALEVVGKVMEELQRLKEVNEKMRAVAEHLQAARDAGAADSAGARHGFMQQLVRRLRSAVTSKG